MGSTKKLEVPWLPAPVWKDFPMTKGLGHHRIPVGIILAANQKISCVIENDNIDLVQIRLLNDDSKTEGIFKITSYDSGQAGTFKHGFVSVPFVDCDYLKKNPTGSRTISVSYPSGSKILPIYRFGDDENKFFQLWDRQDAEFAYVESDYFGLLIPKLDKEVARKLDGGKKLDDLIVFFDKIFTTYSELIGLSFEETGTNQNVRNRFFMKADKHGVGAAYYGDWCTAVNGESTKEFWLDVSHTNWGALHEIGHGHELGNLNDATLNVTEVWNNILAFFYQTIMFGKDMATKGSKQEDMSIANVLKNGVEVTKWDFFQKLSFLIHLFFKAGRKSFTRFNQLTRKEYSGVTYYASGTALVEKLMHFFAIEYEIDVYPFMKLAKAVIREEQQIEHYYVLSKAAYPLSYLISDTKVVKEVQTKLVLPFETSLVTPSDLITSNLKNDFTLKIDPSLFIDLSGGTIKLMDGSYAIVEKKIQSQTIIFNGIPIGVYKVFVEPNISNTKFIYDNFYAVVHASKRSELVFSGKVMKNPFLSPDKIKFLGLGDEHFASLSADPLKKLVIFDFFSREPHSYFENKKYASVEIKNKDNKVLLSQIIQGGSSATGLREIKMDGELQIEIFHAEVQNRLKTEDPMLDAILDHGSYINYLVLNEKGFLNKNKATPKDLPEKIFLNKIELKANKIRGKISLFVRPHCQPKYNILLAVEAFERLFNDKKVSESVRNKYKDCLPAVNAPTN